MAEAYLNEAANGAWRAYSAGSKPTGRPNPFALQTLTAAGVPAMSGDGAPPSSKSWDVFAGTTENNDDNNADNNNGPPAMDVIVTVCDNAAGETCPLWPAKAGRAPMTLHWPFPDPAAVEGTDGEIAAAFSSVFQDIKQRIDAFLAEHAD